MSPSKRSLLLFVILLLPASLFAQTTGGVFTGQVVDASGAALPGVTVTVTNDATGVARAVTTGIDGVYRTPTLVPGRYTAAASLDGFATTTVRNVELNIATTRELNFELRQSAVQESITVTADTPLVATSPSLGTVVSTNELENLP